MPSAKKAGGSLETLDMGPRGKYHVSRGDDERFWGNQGAGILLIARDTGRILLTLRSPEVNEPGTWGIPGGAIDGKEKPASAARREAHEEVGYSGNLELHPAYVFKAPGGNFRYHNFLGVVDGEFEPTLDWENSDSGWFSLDELPSPLHYGVKALLANSKGQIEDIIGRMSEGAVMRDSSLLRRLIREVLVSEAPDPADAETGPDIKASPVAKAAEKRLDAFPSINTALANIKTTKDLQALIQNILDKVVDKGEINQQEMMLALSKTITSSKKAAQKKKKEEAEEEKKKKLQDLEKGVAS